MSSQLTKSKLEEIFENASNKAFKEFVLSLIVTIILAVLVARGFVFLFDFNSLLMSDYPCIVLACSVFNMLGYMQSKDKEIKKQMGQHLDWRE